MQCSTLLIVLFTFRKEIHRAGVQYIVGSVVYYQKWYPESKCAVHYWKCCLLLVIISREQVCNTLLVVLFTFRNNIQTAGLQYSTFLVVFFTFRNDIQRAGVQYIIDSVVESLLKDPSRRLNFKTLIPFNIFIYKAGYIGLTVYHGQRII